MSNRDLAALRSEHGQLVKASPELQGKDVLREHLRANLLGKLEELCNVYDFRWKGKKKVSGAAKLLTSNLCERRIKYLLENPSWDEPAKFDPFYSEKSHFATVFIVDHVKRRLTEAGLDVTLVTEQRFDFGVYDVLLKTRRPNESEAHPPTVRLEIKASFGLPLEQIERYLWDDSPLILVRVISGHAVLLKGENLDEFLRMSIESVSAKADRLINSTGFTIPGAYCSSCPDTSCPYNKRSLTTRQKTVCMTDGEFGRDIGSLLKNLPYVAERAALMVIRELNRSQVQVSSS